MSIFVDRSTRVLVQGITGAAGSFHAEQMLDYGTRVVAGITVCDGPHLLGKTMKAALAARRRRAHAPERGAGRGRAPAKAAKVQDS